LFGYLVNRDVPVDFRPFLQRHARLFGALPRWTVRLFVPAHLVDAAAIFEAAWREELTNPLRLSTADELRWYFEQRRKQRGPSRVPDDVDRGRYLRARDAFGAPRFRVLYRVWLRQGPAALRDVTSPILADAIASRTGQIETQVLAHRYLLCRPASALASGR